MDVSSDLLALVDRAKKLETASDMLRALREVLPIETSGEQSLKLRRELALIRARLRDALQAERSGLRMPDEARKEEEMLTRLARDIAREVISVAEARRLPALAQSLSVVFSAVGGSRAQHESGGVFFLSYRRSDSATLTGLISEGILQRFGRGSVYMDVDSIPLGVNFRAHIVAALADCRACLAIIGPGWLHATDATGKRRLDDVDDPIRVELETALRIDRLVVPILVEGAVIPSRSELPEAMRALSSKNGFPLRRGHEFMSDTQRLFDLLEQQMF
jgi:hypothetical protein